MATTIEGLDDSGVTQAMGMFNDAGKMHLASSSLSTPVFNEQIYSGTTVDTQITDGGLEDYTFWEFHVVGVDADDDIKINISLDGTNFISPGLVDVMTGAHIDQSAANIEAPGIYVFGTVIDQATRVALGVQAIQVSRETATGANPVTVAARAY
jgi:hypothetical protein